MAEVGKLRNWLRKDNEEIRLWDDIRKACFLFTWSLLRGGAWNKLLIERRAAVQSDSRKTVESEVTKAGSSHLRLSLICLTYCLILKMETARWSETSTNIYRTTKRLILQWKVWHFWKRRLIACDHASQFLGICKAHGRPCRSSSG
jgi:hypothetical protein